MEFEVLKKSHVKRNIVIGVVAVLIISAIILNFTSAKYRATDSVPIIHSEINYTPYDFKVMAMYQESDTGEYTEIEEMPSSGYTINEEKSYCTTDNVNKDENAKLYTLSTGEHVFSGLKRSSKCYLYFDEELMAADTILTGKDIQIRSGFSTPVTEETTGVMYQTTDWIGTSYYFAGNPTDNWVKFGGFYWRIVRVNGNGSIRMIYQGTDANRTEETTQIGTSAFNRNDDRSEYVGLKYTTGSQHGQTTDSTILNTLQSWYTSSNLDDYADYIDTSVGFCSDRNMASGSSWSSTGSTHYYAANGRLIDNKSPSLSCTTSDIIKEPIGLIAADEVSFAGGVFGINNTSYYLYNNQDYWTMSPSYFNDGLVGVFLVFSNGSITLDVWFVSDTFGVRPVINLKADTQFTGEGTVNSPFEVAS